MEEYISRTQEHLKRKMVIIERFQKKLVKMNKNSTKRTINKILDKNNDDFFDINNSDDDRNLLNNLGV